MQQTQLPAPPPPGQRLVVNPDGSYFYVANRKFGTGWYWLVLLGPPGMFVALIMAAGWETNKTGRMIARIILAICIIIWIVGVATYGTRR